MHTERLRILLVDDDDVDRSMMECFIKEAGLPYDLLVARNVAEAIAHLCVGRFDIVITEYRLPDGYGLEVQRYAAQIPCIYFTRAASREAVIRAMKAGAYDYVIKDSQWEYLRELPIAIREALERKESSHTVATSPLPFYVAPSQDVQS
jgi:DNA-binding NtrC family response regulator